MTALVVILSILTYLAIGSAAGRAIFVRIMQAGSNRRYYDGNSTLTYDRARTWAVLTLLGWPAAVWFLLMFRATSTEKLERRQQQLADVEAELKAVAEKYKLSL